MADDGKLARYRARRDFGATVEPEGETAASGATLAFHLQKHDATTLHYDLRLEWRGVLLSWAVTKGPSRDPSDKRLAVRTEDHPLDYGDFEGTIPAEQYGGGTVMHWDRGTWEPLDDPDAGLAGGKLHFRLHGARMRGGWALVRMRGADRRDSWLLVKEDDAEASDGADDLLERYTRSVATGRGMSAIAEGRAARGGDRPAFRKPQLATLAEAAPQGADWVFETKFDGYRALAAVGGDGARLFTRSGQDWTETFAALGGAFDRLPCDTALLDGEVMAASGDGSPFSALQSALSEGRALRFHVFDLLSLDGADMTGAPLHERRRRLEALFAEIDQRGALRLSDQAGGDGPAILARACEAGGEGIIAKRRDAPYRVGRRAKAWLKIKCTRRQEFVIAGYSRTDKASRPFSSLLLGAYGAEGLVYRGRVGAGFDRDAFRRVTARMETRRTAPFASVPREIARDAVWLRPDMVAEVDFTELTDDGHVRHPTFLGLRDDKVAKEVRMEGTDADGRPEAEGVGISHPERTLFPRAETTKLDLARHYEAAAPRMLKIAGHRPLALMRCPEGIEAECFFQKHPGKGFPDEIGHVALTESSGERAEHVCATREAAFAAAAQMGAIEVHMWGARTDRLERPDRLVFDLDPGVGAGWEAVRAAAFETRDLLAELGLAAGALVTGGKGVHVWVALRRTAVWESAKLFARGVAEVLAARAPDRYTATMSKDTRTGRIFVDYLRNEYGATAIAPYSVRARPGAPVAMPVTWDELAGLGSADAFGLEAAAARLAEPCPYLARLAALQTLSRATAEELEKRHPGE